MIKRIFDITFSIFGISIFFFPILLISILIFFSSPGPIIHWSKRIGYDSKPFRMPKFRTMKIDTPNKASHLLNNPDFYVTRIGKFLRLSSLDELPQLISVIKGDMSLVGPRPALFNQHDLVLLRKKKGIDKLLPGITGWAQINGRDKVSTSVKVKLDEEYLKNQSIYFDLKVILFTIFKIIDHNKISH